MVPISSSEFGTLHVNDPEFLMLAAIGPRLLRFFWGPLRSSIVTVPLVSGFQVMVNGFEVSTSDPTLGYVMAFFPLVCAKTVGAKGRKESSSADARLAKRILEVCKEGRCLIAAAASREDSKDSKKGMKTTKERLKRVNTSKKESG